MTALQLAVCGCAAFADRETPIAKWNCQAIRLLFFLLPPLTKIACMLCAGAQWETASEVFELIEAQGCVTGEATYVAFMRIFEEGGQWRRVRSRDKQMRLQHCMPEAVGYYASIDTCWENGATRGQGKVRRCCHLCSMSTLLAGMMQASC